MYSLDVNFLNDRPDYRPPEQGKKPHPQKMGSMTPLIIGVVVGLLLPGLVGGLWLFLQQQNAQKNDELNGLKAELAKQQAEKQKLEQLNDQITKVQSDTKALASVFEQIKPWSAILQDIRERIPPNVQIQTIQQKQLAASATPPPVAKAAPKGNKPSNANKSPNAKAAPNAQAANNPTPTTQLAISGRARSFDEVNYFLLMLQQSPFFKKEETQLVKADLEASRAKLEKNLPQSQTQSGARVTYELPKDVEYQILTTLSDATASELLRELDRKGAVGLVTRLRNLQEKGATQP
jgi:type IV pilus assembly protein PilN